QIDLAPAWKMLELDGQEVAREVRALEIPVGIERLIGRHGANRFGRIPIDEVDEAVRFREVLIAEERLEVPMEAGGFEIPVDGQSPLAIAGEDPRDVGERHRPPGAALVRVERENPSWCTRHGRQFPIAPLIENFPGPFGTWRSTLARLTTSPFST